MKRIDKLLLLARKSRADHEPFTMAIHRGSVWWLCVAGGELVRLDQQPPPSTTFIFDREEAEV